MLHEWVDWSWNSCAKNTCLRNIHAILNGLRQQTKPILAFSLLLFKIAGKNIEIFFNGKAVETLSLNLKSRSTLIVVFLVENNSSEEFILHIPEDRKFLSFKFSSNFAETA